MIISDLVIEDLKKEINSRLEGTYKKVMKLFTEVDFNEFLEEMIDEIKKEVESLLEVNSVDISLVNRRVKKTKQRWFKKEMKEKNAFYKEMKMAKELNDSLSKKEEMYKFEAVYDGAKDYEDLRAKVIEKLENWVQDDNALLTDFRYLDSKQGYQIKRAFVNDALYIGLNLLKDKYPHGNQNSIVGIPRVMGIIPIDHTNRARINHENKIERIEKINNRVVKKSYFVNKYIVDDDFMVESLIDVDILKKGVMAETLKLLGWNDMDIFFILLSQRDENFFRTREIITDIGTIVKEKYASRNAANYRSVRESLWRMEHLSTGIIKPSLSGFTFRLLEYVQIGSMVRGEDGNIVKENNGDDEEIDNKDENYVRVIVSDSVVKDYFMDRTIKMYRDVIDKVKLDASKILLFRLQQERVRCLMEGTNVFNTNLNFFKSALYFTNKRKSENIKMVERALNEIVEHKILLKSYTRNKDMFQLKFYPMTEREKRDLIGEEANKEYYKSFNELIGRHKDKDKDENLLKDEGLLLK